MSSKRVFSEQEAAEIIQRAVRMQEAAPTSEYTPGITEEELVKIAREAGIDPSYIQKAILGADVEEKSKTGLFNLTEEFTRVVDGEIDPENFDKIMNLFAHTQKNGLKQVGRTLSGQVPAGGHLVSMNIESRKGRTKVSVKYIPVFAYLMGLHGPLIAGIVLLASQIEAGRPWLGAGLAAGLFVAGGTAFKALVKAGRKAARKLTGKIVEVVEDDVTLRDRLEGSSPSSIETLEGQQERI